MLGYKKKPQTQPKGAFETFSQSTDIVFGLIIVTGLPCRWAYWTVSVSYTHLDVYKRQLVYCGATNVLDENADYTSSDTGDIRQIEAVTRILGNEFGMDVAPVSYTHLDVYKRQTNG